MSTATANKACFVVETPGKPPRYYEMEIRWKHSPSRRPAPAKDKTMKIELFRDRDHKWHIRIRASNGRILMSSEAYSAKSKALNTAYAIRRRFRFGSLVPVVDRIAR